jgi:hypothetical protein
MSTHLRRLLRFFLLMALGGAGIVIAQDCGAWRDYVGTASLVLGILGFILFCDALGNT